MKLVWSSRALLDLQRLADRITADGKPLAATAFAAEIFEATRLLTEQPLMGRAGRRHDTREWIAHRNHLLVYRVRGDEVQILQLWHVARQLLR